MTAKPDKALWRKTFDKAERAIGGRLEEMIDTRQFADAMSMSARVQKGVAKQVYGTIHRTLHVFGLSSLKDTRAIARQLNRVEAQLREVSAQLEALEEQSPPPEPVKKPSGARTVAAKRTASPKSRRPATGPAKNASNDHGIAEG